MQTKNYAMVSAIIFTIVTLAHIWRLYSGAEVMLNGAPVPMAGSWFGVIIAAIMAIWGFKIAARN